MFNFRIVETTNGVEVIDTNLKTPMESLTPMDLIDYIETEKILYSIELASKRKYRKVG